MTAGLWVFIAVVALNAAGLLLDGGLALAGLPTVTNYVRTTLMGQVLGSAILFVQLIGVAGLFCHFFPSF